MAQPVGQRAKPVGQRAKPAGQRAKPVGQSTKPVGQSTQPAGAWPPGSSGRAPGSSGRAPGSSGRAPGSSGRAPGSSGRAPGKLRLATRKLRVGSTLTKPLKKCPTKRCNHGPAPAQCGQACLTGRHIPKSPEEAVPPTILFRPLKRAFIFFGAATVGRARPHCIAASRQSFDLKSLIPPALR